MMLLEHAVDVRQPFFHVCQACRVGLYAVGFVFRFAGDVVDFDACALDAFCHLLCSGEKVRNTFQGFAGL